MSRGIVAACVAFAASGCAGDQAAPYLRTVTVVLRSDDLIINQKMVIRCIKNQDASPGEVPFVPEFKTAIYNGSNYALLLDLSTDFYCGPSVVYDRSHQTRLIPGISLLHIGRSGMVFDSVSGPAGELLSDKWALQIDLLSVKDRDPGSASGELGVINYQRPLDSFVADKPLRKDMVPFDRPVFYVADGGVLRSHRESEAALPPSASTLFRRLVNLSQGQSLTRCDIEQYIDLTELRLPPAKCSSSRSGERRTKLAYPDSFLERRDGSWLGPLSDPGWTRMFSSNRTVCMSSRTRCRISYQLEAFPGLKMDVTENEEFARWSSSERLIYILKPSVKISYVDVACIRRACDE